MSRFFRFSKSVLFLSIQFRTFGIIERFHLIVTALWQSRYIDRLRERQRGCARVIPRESIIGKAPKLFNRLCSDLSIGMKNASHFEGYRYRESEL